MAASNGSRPAAECLDGVIFIASSPTGPRPSRKRSLTTDAR